MDIHDLLAKADDIVADIEGGIFSVTVYTDTSHNIWPDIQIHLHAGSSRNRAMHSIESASLRAYTNSEVRFSTLDGTVISLIGGCV